MSLPGLPSVETARALMLDRVVALPAETVACDAALGRTLLEAIFATRDQPPFAASAMDGWAVRSDDLGDLPATLAIVGESAAGHGWTGTLEPGQAVRISTGAPVPDGADRVVMQEAVTRIGERVTIASPGANRFVRPRAADFSAGDQLLAPSVRLDPWRIALAAAAGRSTLVVGARPRVTIVPTGDELAAPGAEPGPWQIHDAAGAALAAWFAARGCVVDRLGALPDDLPAVTRALDKVDCDLLVTIGGASVGDHDVIKPALAALGLKLVVDGVAVRPGKPTWFGVLPNGRRVLGLPGNPVSAMVCAELFGGPVVAGLEGATIRENRMHARLGAPLAANGPREHYVRARIERDPERGFVAAAAGDQDSSLLSVLAGAGGLIRRLPNAPAADAGEVVDILLLDRAGLVR